MPVLWLQQTLGKAYQTTEDQVISGQQVPKGYWLVKAKWYQLVQTSQRAYVLRGDEIQLNVNAMVRLPEPVRFETVKARKTKPVVLTAAASRPQRAGADAAAPPAPPQPAQWENPHFLGESEHNEILASLAQV
jgi:hypothetical protein